MKKILMTVLIIGCGTESTDNFMPLKTHSLNEKITLNGSTLPLSDVVEATLLYAAPQLNAKDTTTVTKGENNDTDTLSQPESEIMEGDTTVTDDVNEIVALSHTQLGLDSGNTVYELQQKGRHGDSTAIEILTVCSAIPFIQKLKENVQIEVADFYNADSIVSGDSVSEVLLYNAKLNEDGQALLNNLQEMYKIMFAKTDNQNRQQDLKELLEDSRHLIVSNPDLKEAVLFRLDRALCLYRFLVNNQWIEVADKMLEPLKEEMKNFVSFFEIANKALVGTNVALPLRLK